MSVKKSKGAERFEDATKSSMPPSAEEHSWHSHLSRVLRWSPFAFASDQLEDHYQQSQDFFLGSLAQLFHFFSLMLAFTSIASHRNQPQPPLVSWLWWALIAHSGIALILKNFQPRVYSHVSDILSGALKVNLALAQLLLRRSEGLGEAPLSPAIFLQDFCSASMATMVNIQAIGLPMHFAPLLLTQLITTGIAMSGNTELCHAHAASPFMAANTDQLAARVARPVGDVFMRAIPLPLGLAAHDFGSCEAVMSLVQISLGFVTALVFLGHEVMSRRGYVAAHGLDQGHPARWPFSSSTHALLVLEIPALMALASGAFWLSYVATVVDKM